ENLFLAKEHIDRKEKELQALDRISHLIRSSIVLDDLLEIIKDQVLNLIDADNFYVALLDVDREELWYPIAVRDGKVKKWPRRHMMSRRLTDRVIQSGEALLFSFGNHDQVNPSELPPSIALTKAWLGVPLITSKGTIGCIAVFSEDENQNFYEEDLNLLTILSAQVSTAIENALLYGQVSKRVKQFETLSELTRSLSTSLQIEEVLDEVCISVIKSGNANQSVIYLLDERKKTFRLAKEIGLPE
ncbi:MAG: GAF domain-containing protein, partial [Aliifodinibius sp.]|nr:GAF domain-containing protein [Candidatus Saccharibacteria bacterium]NIT61576.1 GAF domain-containing protein [Fodinibius sp.]NIV16178.1 GAF domain-containing protein [Fodinibius sp.]NIY30156.1 GAF domain-containing protein [Fodinibius sp.]